MLAANPLVDENLMPEHSSKIEVTPIQLPLIKRGMDVPTLIVEAAKKLKITFNDGDVLAVADKVLAVSNGRVADLIKVNPSPKARRLAKKYNLEPEFVEIVLKDADAVYGGVSRALLTLKHGVFIANSGIDHKNMPENEASLWAEDPNDSAKLLREALQNLTHKKLAVILVDSHVIALRAGTVGFALGIAGFEPLRDVRGFLDLYGKPLLITQVNMADSLAAMANLVIGETDERTPVALIHGAPIQVTDSYNPLSVRIDIEADLFSSIFKVSRKGLK